MMWLIGIGALAVGVIIGVISAGKLGRTDTARIQELEKQLDALQHRYDSYRTSVSEHFSTTAELIHNMTESYRDVYQHLAGGAQKLCSEEVADKMLPGREESPLFNETPRADDNDEQSSGNDEATRSAHSEFGSTQASAHDDSAATGSASTGSSAYEDSTSTGSRMGDEERAADRT